MEELGMKDSPEEAGTFRKGDNSTDSFLPPSGVNRFSAKPSASNGDLQAHPPWPWDTSPAL